MLLLRRPSAERIARYLQSAQARPLSYAPIGLANMRDSGFTVDEEVAVIGHGRTSFADATAALWAWRHFDLGWVELFPRNAAPEPGTVVAVLIRHLGFWSLNSCRVVYALEAGQPGEIGFAYGTLGDHAERGEELFLIRRHPASDDVSYVIRAASQPRAWLARLGYPYVRYLQRCFRRDSARAMLLAVSKAEACRE